MTATACFVTTLADNRVGFSEPPRGDSEGTVQRLEAYRRQLAYPRIEEHHGRIIRPGDNMLVEFASATEAVRCAVEVQRGVIDRNVGASLDRRITLGVGVDIGETAAIGDDLVSRVVAALPTDELASLVKPGSHRDGGDVAVRLAALAGPAGICISGKVRDAIGEQLPYTFTDIGKQNIDLRASQMHCYVMSADSPAAKPYVAGRKQGGVIRLCEVAVCGYRSEPVCERRPWDRRHMDVVERRFLDSTNQTPGARRLTHTTSQRHRGAVSASICSPQQHRGR
jgi:adenylate cyclase